MTRGTDTVPALGGNGLVPARIECAHSRVAHVPASRYGR